MKLKPGILKLNEIVSLLKEANLLLEESIKYEKDVSYLYDITNNSQKVKPHTIFVAIKGTNVDGHIFIPQIISKDVLIIGEVDISFDGNYIRVSNSRKSYALLCTTFWNNSKNNFNLIGITGTNGKTTTSFIIKKILETNGIKAGIIGTIGIYYKNKHIPLDNTTPDAYELNKYIHLLQKEKINDIIMEVSSHAIDQHRIYGLNFSAGIFTNLTQDHLDYHKTLQNYAEVKFRFFQDYLHKKLKIFNIEDTYGKIFYEKNPSNSITYGFSKKANVFASNIKPGVQGYKFDLHYENQKIEIETTLSGRYNILNILAAISVNKLYGFKLNDIKKALKEKIYIPGRLEEYHTKDGKRIFIDYAHTPNALENVLKTLRELTKNKKIITIFGCGGNRDSGKRPIMGKIVEEYSDFFIITSDNPRFENPEKIAKDIEKGLSQKKYTIILDRKKAIIEGIKRASQGDTILIAGKGHEDYQEIQGKKIPFSDRKVLTEYIKNQEQEK